MSQNVKTFMCVLQSVSVLKLSKLWGTRAMGYADVVCPVSVANKPTFFEVLGSHFDSVIQAGQVSDYLAPTSRSPPGTRTNPGSPIGVTCRI